MNNKFEIATAESITMDKAIGDFIRDIRDDSRFQGNLEYQAEQQKKLDEFIKKGKSTKTTPPNQLVVLRKWNSYTPLLPPSREDFVSKGGGYFLRMGNTGIVIDPGFNFIENYLEAGFKLDDIDHIFLSHAHNDHTVELEGIFSLLFKRNKREKPPKKIKLYMNLGAFKKYSGYFDLSKPPGKTYIDDIILLN